MNSRLAFWLGLFCLALYLLSYSGQIRSLPDLAIMAAGNDFLRHGRIGITQMWQTQVLGVPPSFVVALPLMWLGQIIPGLNPVQVGLLTPLFIGAVRVGLCYLSLTVVLRSQETALLVTLAYAALLGLWLAAGGYWELPLVLLIGWLAFLSLVRWGRWGRPLLRNAKRWLWPLAISLLVCAGLAWWLVGGVTHPRLGDSGMALFFDPAWLRLAGNGLSFQLHILLSPLILLILAGGNLWQVTQSRGNGVLTRPLLAIALTLFLLAQMLLSIAHLRANLAKTNRDTQLSQALNRASQPTDLLLVPLSLQSESYQLAETLLLTLEPPLPTELWFGPENGAVDVEAGPQAIRRVWLIETDRSDASYSRLLTTFERQAFFTEAQAFAEGDRLLLYTFSDQTPETIPIDVPFAGGLHLNSFAAPTASYKPGDTVTLRLTWAWQEPSEAAEPLPLATVAFAHLLDDAHNGRVAAQQDRLLVDLEQLVQSPLQPGQTVSQGYALPLPATLPPGPYSIIVGLYDPGTVQRLVRADGNPDDFLYLTTIMVE